MVISRLGWYILKEHFGPFVFALVAITFLLVIDYVPQIVDSVLTTGLSLVLAIELVVLNIAWMVTLSVPMSVLVATLFAFGRLGADFETLAIKSLGINIIRAMVPLLAAGMVLTLIMIWFMDMILPDINHSARLLADSVLRSKPTFEFRAKSYIQDFPGLILYADSIDHQTSALMGVWISEERERGEGRITTAEIGNLGMGGIGTLEFKLTNGQVHTLDRTRVREYRKVTFEEATIRLRVTASDASEYPIFQRTDRELSVDSLQARIGDRTKLIRRLTSELGEIIDLSTPNEGELKSSHITEADRDVYAPPPYLSSTDTRVRRLRNRINAEQSQINRFQVELQKKYSIPAACTIFIVFGAPMGLRSRRAGWGPPIAMSIVLFIVYWAFLIAGEDLADRGLISPAVAMWAANILLGAVGILLLATGQNDSFLVGRRRRLR